MHGARAALALAAVALLALPCVSTAAEPEEAPASVPELLRKIADEADPSEYAYLNDRRADMLGRTLEETTDLQERVRLAHRLGQELLYAGRTEAAIWVFEDLRRLFERPEVKAAPGLLQELGEALAVAWMRLGEQENCLAHHTARSCILPIDPSARHGAERGARRAIAELEALLAEDPASPYAWLLNLAWMTLGGYPEKVPEAHRVPPEALASEVDHPAFEDRAAAAGVDMVGTSGGAVVEDLDGDGLLDIVASAWGLEEQMRLFRNAGDGTFEDRTAAAGLEGQLGGLNLVHADHDNDGDADILVLRGAWLSTSGRHPDSLLRNDGDGTFTDVTREAGLLSFHPTQTAAWADFDGDGWLDLFVGNESDARHAAPCRLYRNRGDGTFDEVAAEVGLDVVGFVKGTAWGDFDNDGRPDLYLSRLGQPNLLFRNLGPAPDADGESWSWRFAEVTGEAGVGAPARSFPTWFWDYDNDGWLDLMVASFSGFYDATSLKAVVAELYGRPTGAARPRLYRNGGDGTFADVTRPAGLDRALLAMGANFADVDGDGFLDAYFGTGAPHLATLVPNRLFHNDGGRRFLDATSAAGLGHLQKGHGIAFGDLDNDGDEDIYAVLGGAYSGDVYPNALFVNPGPSRPFVSLRLEGTRSNRAAIGARVRVVTRAAEGAEGVIHRVVGTGGSFGSSSLRLTVGLGAATAVERVEVDWPGGGSERFTGIHPGHLYRLREGSGQAAEETLRRIDIGTGPTHHGPRNGLPEAVDHDP